MHEDIFIIDALRTPIGGMGKSLRDCSAVNLGAVVIKALINRSKIKRSLINEVILGNAIGARLGQNPARQSLINAGLPSNIPAFTVNKVCGSGLKAVILAAQAISCQDSDIIIAGGIESASQSPYIISRNKKFQELKEEDMQDSLIRDGLWCAFNNTHMGIIAEDTAKRFKISRQEQDAYALESQQKAVYAQEKGLFKDEITPVKTGKACTFSVDEKPRQSLTMEKLSRVSPAFTTKGTVTAGNSPAPADGSAALILASARSIKKNRIVPRARILGYAIVAMEPKDVFITPSKAIKACLRQSSLKQSDIDLFEVNEAFAVAALLTIQLAKLDIKRVNVSGGTIALGHPLGASGARGLVTLIHSLSMRKKKIGITVTCLGGGCAIALAIRMVD